MFFNLHKVQNPNKNLHYFFTCMHYFAEWPPDVSCGFQPTDISRKFLCTFQTTTVTQTHTKFIQVIGIFTGCAPLSLSLSPQMTSVYWVTWCGELGMVSVSCLQPHNVVNTMPRPSPTHHTMSLSKTFVICGETETERGAHSPYQWASTLCTFLCEYIFNLHCFCCLWSLQEHISHVNLEVPVLWKVLLPFSSLHTGWLTISTYITIFMFNCRC